MCNILPALSVKPCNAPPPPCNRNPHQGLNILPTANSGIKVIVFLNFACEECSAKKAFAPKFAETNQLCQNGLASNEVLYPGRRCSIMTSSTCAWAFVIRPATKTININPFFITFL